MSKRIFFPTVLSLLFCSPLMADPSSYREAYNECMSTSGSTTSAIVYGCAEGVSEDAKAEMTQLYKQIYDRLAERSQKDANQFEKSQMRWLGYRNRHCDIEGKYVGSPSYSVCPMYMNADRVDELRSLLEVL